MSRNALKTQRDTTVGEPFKWRMSGGGKVAPADMETSHLFHTISMIWNHSMPEDAATHAYFRYRFDAAKYPAHYMRLAVVVMLPELLARPNLTAKMRARLDFMAAYVAAHPGALPPMRLALPKPEEA